MGEEHLLNPGIVPIIWDVLLTVAGPLVDCWLEFTSVEGDSALLEFEGPANVERLANVDGPTTVDGPACVAAELPMPDSDCGATQNYQYNNGPGGNIHSPSESAALVTVTSCPASSVGFFFLKFAIIWTTCPLPRKVTIHGAPTRSCLWRTRIASEVAFLPR